MKRIQGKQLAFYAGRDVTDFYVADEADGRFTELEQQLALANDAAAKGEAARLAAAGMEAHIDELQASHHAAVIALKDELVKAQQAIQRMTVEAMAADEKYRALKNRISP